MEGTAITIISVVATAILGVISTLSFKKKYDMAINFMDTVIEALRDRKLTEEEIQSIIDAWEALRGKDSGESE